MAFDFSGTAQYFSRTSAPVTAMPLTMACWFNADNNTASLNLMGIDSGAATNRYSLQTAGAIGGDPVRAITQSPGGNGSAVSSIAYSLNTWQHCCGVFTSTTSRKVYLDGGNSGTDATSSNPGSITTLAIGNSPASGANVFDGRIAEAGIWNVSLDADEVAALAKGYSPLLIRPSALVFYWPGVRTGLVDLKGAPLTATGSPTVADHPRIIYPRRRQARRVSTATADITLALTGIAATSSIGNLGTGSLFTVATTGTAATAGQGTIAPARSLALTGTAATSAIGNLSTAALITLGLVGSSATSAIGTVTYNAGSNLTLALTGVAVTAAIGMLGLGLSKGVTGSAATAAPGSLAPGISKGITASGLTASIGTLGRGSLVTLGLSGTQCTSALGVIAASGGTSDIWTVIPAPSTTWANVNGPTNIWTEVANPTTPWTTS